MNRSIEAIPTWALCYIINGDASGLTDEEIRMVDEAIRKNNITSVRDNKLCLKALSCIYIRDIGAWQPSIYHGWLLRQNPHVKYAMLEKTQLFRIFDNVSSKCLGLVVKETVCP